MTYDWEGPTAYQEASQTQIYHYDLNHQYMKEIKVIYLRQHLVLHQYWVSYRDDDPWPFWLYMTFRR